MFNENAAVLALLIIVGEAGVKKQRQEPTGATKTISASPTSNTAVVSEVLKNWPQVPRTVAGMLIDKYGPPDKVSRSSLVWKNKGPWLTTVVRRAGEFHHFPQKHRKVLRQSIRYYLPAEKVAALTGLDAGLQWNHDSRELSAASESEESNILALNIADNIATGRLSAAQARKELLQTTAAFNSGRTSPYMKRLWFVAH